MTVLRMRDDQEEIVLKGTIEPPFSIKADDDAKRFQVGAGPASKVSEQSPEQAQLEAKIDEEGENLSAAASAKVATMVEELSRTYSQPEPAHVDH